MMLLSIVRHGECAAQLDHRAGSDSELTALGREQSLLAGRALAMLGVTHLVTSPLVRALDTTAIIAAQLGPLPIQVWTEVRENHPHLHRGYGRIVLGQRLPQAVLPDTIGDDGWLHGRDDAESASVRCQSVLSRLGAEFGRDDHLALVTHGGFTSYLLHAILDLSPSAPHWFQMNNGAISQLRFVPEADRFPNPLYSMIVVEVLRLNDTRHLD